MLAYEYPLLGLFWTMLWFFLWFAWIMLLFRIFADIFRNHEMGGFGKAMWSIFVIIVPLLGTLVYLIANGNEMGKRDLDQACAQQQQFDAYIRETASASGGASTAEELSKLAALKDQGVLSDAEFAAQKAKLLG